MPANKQRRSIKLDWVIYLHEMENKVFRGADHHTGQSGISIRSGEESHIQSLLAKSQHTHWTVREQAARDLGQVRHPDACQALIQLLKDERCSVSWTAAHSLINLRRCAVRPLLEELTRDFQSTCFLKASHHILSELHHYGELTSEEVRVLHTLKHVKKGLMIAQIANEALIAGQASTV